MRTVKECGEMKNPRAKRAKLLFFIFKFSKCSCYPVYIMFFEDKIKELQVRHTFKNDYFDVVFGNVRKI